MRERERESEGEGEGEGETAEAAAAARIARPAATSFSEKVETRIPLVMLT